MSVSATRDRPAANGHATPPPIPGRYRLQAGWIKLGMFVCALDRPWLDTPFMMQGFLVTTPREVDALQQYCRHAVVDVDASRPEVVALILERGEPVEDDDECAGTGNEAPGDGPVVRSPPAPRSARNATRGPHAATIRGAGAGPRRPPVARGELARTTAAAVPPSAGAGRPGVRAATISGTPTAAAPRRGRLFGWLKSMFAPGGTRRAGGPERAAGGLPADLAREIRATLLPGETAREWTETRPIEQELPRARTAYAGGEQALRKVFDDLSGGEALDLEPVRLALDDVVSSMTDNPNALLWLAHLRDRHERTYRHALKVALYMVALGRQLGFPRAQLVQLGMTGLFADLGKTRLPSALLEKPGTLTAAEFALVQRHVDYSLELLARTPGLPEEVRLGIEQHHERMDGSGYPNGLTGAQIGLYGRMAGIADCFAAITSRRPYADAMTPFRALTSLFEWSRTAFHEPLVEQLVQAIGVFPVGSMIELSSGEVAVVLAHNRVRRLEPRVLVLTDADKRPLREPVTRDLMARPGNEDAAPTYILRGLPPGAYGLPARDWFVDGRAGEPVGP